MPLSLPRVLFGSALLLSMQFQGWAVGQNSTIPRVSQTHTVVFYAPETNLERLEVETLRKAKSSVDIAMYSFTDRELATELVRLAQAGVRIRVYRDAREYTQEYQHGASTTELLIAAGIEVRVRSSHDLMHLKSYIVDGILLRSGSANWSPTGLKRQDNDVTYVEDTSLAQVFGKHFTELWDRPDNRAVSLREGNR